MKGDSIVSIRSLRERPKILVHLANCITIGMNPRDEYCSSRIHCHCTKKEERVPA